MEMSIAIMNGFGQVPCKLIPEKIFMIIDWANVSTILVAPPLLSQNHEHFSPY